MKFYMVITTIMVARNTNAEMVSSLEANSSSSKNNFKQCGEKNMFSNLPETFPITKPSCYWFMYSDLIFYEYINLNSSECYSNCRKFIKDRCGLEKTDVVFWLNKQEETTKNCVKYFYEDFNENYDEDCKNAQEMPIVYPIFDDLPYCSLRYSYFTTNFNLSMQKNSRTV